MEELEGQILILIRDVYTWAGWPGVVILMAIESASIPFPSEIIMPLAGWMLVREPGLGVAYILVAGFYGALGCAIGSSVAYWMGAWGGRPFIERYGRYFFISRHHLDMADRWFARYGEWAAFLSRLMPVVRTFISFPAGVARMNFLRFLIYSFLGSLPWCWVLAYGGYLLGEHWEQIRAVMRPFDLPIVAAIILGLVFFWWRRGKKVMAEDQT